MAKQQTNRCKWHPKVLVQITSFVSPVRVSPPLMGCGVSRFDNAGEDRQSRQLRLVERKNGHGVVISKPLPADGNGDDSSKGKVRFDESGRDRHKDEFPEDDESYIPHTLSFRVYCNTSSDDNIQDDRNTGNMMDKQEEGAESHKGSSTRSGRRGKIGKGLKCILRG
ncbi:hypothetical protein GQ457_02G021370 [Hibiscus cannabinus]